MDRKAYAKQYYANLKAKRADQQVAEFKPVDLSKVLPLEQLFVNGDLMRQYRTNTTLDTMFSHEGGIPVGTNVMVTGDPGAGKTTMMMYALSHLQRVNPNAKCVFVSAEMSKLQVFKYTQRFPEFANLETLFTSDFMDSNIRDVMEQLLDKGYDFVLVDSIIEIFESLKEDCGMSQGQAEKWLTNLCVKHNEAGNSAGKHTTFLLIQQVTKNGIFVGSNRVKHITDAHMELKRDSERDGGGTYAMFSKNRNGQAGVRYNYRLGASTIAFDELVHSETDGVSFALEERSF
jgi:predicted ATP-dependent serine protease